MRSKKIPALLVFSMLLAGCSSGSGQESSAPPETGMPAAETASETGSAAEAAVEPITLTLFIDDPENFSVPETALAEIAEKTGVTLEMTAGSEEELDELFTAGKMPDLLYAGERTEEFIGSGLLAAVPESGNFSALYGEKLDRMRAEDGNLYTYGTGGSSAANFDTDGTFQVRYSVLEELGYPEVKTLDQLEDCLRRYKELHPESTGLLLCGSPRQQWLDTVSVRVNYVLGYPDDGEFLVDEETGTAVYKWLDPRTKEFMKWLNHMYNEGLLDEKSFSLKHNAYVDRLTNGSAAAAADYREDYEDAGGLYCPLPVTLDEDTKAVFFADYGYTPADGIAVTASCKDRDRAFEFMDWLCGDGLEYGLEEPFPMGASDEKDADGNFRYSAAREYAESLSEEEKAAAEGYGVTLISELFPRERDLPVFTRTLVSDMEIPELSETAILLETLETYLKTEVPNAIMSPEEEFDSRWDEITDWCGKNGALWLNDLVTEMVRNDMG